MGKHSIRVLRALTGCSAETAEDIVQRVADLLYVGDQRKIRQRALVDRVLAAHDDLREIDEHLEKVAALGDIDG